LGCVVIESCSDRWEKILKRQPKGSFLRLLLDNEMQTAQEICDYYQKPVVLGDQNISHTIFRLKETFTQTLKDVTNPVQGWMLVGKDVSSAIKDAFFIPESSVNNLKYLTFGNFIDINLIINFPVSIIRYILAILLKSPAVTPILFVFGYILAYSNPSPVSNELDLKDFVESIPIFILEFALLGRTFLVALLNERNEILARNIRESCRKMQQKGDSEINSGDLVCIAVLGMAHSNGVANILANR